MHELLYDLPSVAIACLLFVAMMVTIEVTYRIGFTRRRPPDDAFTAHINAIQAALLGILALMLGFTFSISLQRFDSRSEAVVDEANAIGTAYLRTQLLSPPLRGEVQKLMRDYLDLRIREGNTTLVHHAERKALIDQSNRTMAAIWERAMEAVQQDPRVVTSGMFVESLNHAIDAFGKRDAAIDRHVPEIVLLLLFGTFLMACVSIGYAAGISGYRASLVTYVLVALIVVLVFLIIDVDRPRRGFITISHKSMTDLQANILNAQTAAPGGSPLR